MSASAPQFWLCRAVILGVEKVVTDLPSHSEPCMRLSPHTAPSLTVPLLRIQLDFLWLTLYYLV
ncbi:MAG: hypothetical protein EWV40_14190 [Microcystis flos-aquae Mf_WU_F_19750830_S460]|uniref:Uncharacterized protein n=1 Tax=Microcystis flos-aquae Mf_WU_F_19750830_S460 TaxID=2486237 RepID=A0A552LIG2_9CHRO|nr:MAG: hypothetical protein EWV40_14190 [Microcystis flos-aquae Mf_WU_F_19750830_S460]